jgi:hypothetical protein
VQKDGNVFDVGAHPEVITSIANLSVVTLVDMMAGNHRSPDRGYSGGGSDGYKMGSGH